MISKESLRKFIKDRRNSIDSSEYGLFSNIIFEKLLNLDVFKNSSRIYTYCAFRNEVDTKAIINYGFSNDIPIAVPKVRGDEMFFYEISSFNQLQKGYMGIPEPIEGLEATDADNGVIIVPGTAFDKECNRMGYGGGFYDRFLAKHPDLIKIGIAYDFQIFDKIKTNPYDISMDYVITDNTIIKRD